MKTRKVIGEPSLNQLTYLKFEALLKQTQPRIRTS